jgi:NAD(P)-dependent dehydrogenase (short-subunit alcohol dehydrogenase family)
VSRPVAILFATGPGMGQAIAARFARGGFRCVLVGRSMATLEAVAAGIAENGGETALFTADLGELAACQSVLANLVAAYPAPDVVVFNGGVMRVGPALDLSPGDFLRDLNLGVVAAHAAVTAFAPAMVARGSGSLLFTGGGLALYPQYGAEMVSLVAAKAALRGYVLALHEALAPQGLTVGTVTIAGTVAPGTPFDPDLIAEHYWKLHSGGPGASAEIVYDGSGAPAT